ncbi:MAG TPA: glycosyltransferase [Terriglobales bacterium]|nr:glycosyltransferase [Terriglobales bacterium]
MSAVRRDLAFVVATMDRPGPLSRLLESLAAQTVVPAEVVVVDGGAAPAADLCWGPRPFAVRHIPFRPPSTARQRNAGLEAVSSGIAFVGFLDDDVLLEPGAVGAMMAFFDAAAAEVGGAAFNMSNHPPLRAARWKSSRFAERAGLYGRRPGAVMKSGFQTMIGPLAADLRTDWLPSGAVVWRRDVLRRTKFDDWFADYGYLEDLDLSYRAGKSSVLVAVAGARYSHHPDASPRPDPYRFGRKEVANRLRFVAKNPELSPALCRLALVVRMVMSLSDGLFLGQRAELRRVRGNMAGFLGPGPGPEAARRKRNGR